jgi:ubiquinone biosynthesis protein UbiJ
MSYFEGEADTTLAGPVSRFIGLAAGAENGGFFSGELTIRGDVELGREFQRIFSTLDLDLESAVM